MGVRSEDQPRHAAVLWNRFILHARQKLYRLHGRRGQKQGDTRDDLELMACYATLPPQNETSSSYSFTFKERLGQFAHEDEMPSWLRHYLLSGDDNSKDGKHWEL